MRYLFGSDRLLSQEHWNACCNELRLFWKRPNLLGVTIPCLIKCLSEEEVVVSVNQDNPRRLLEVVKSDVMTDLEELPSHSTLSIKRPVGGLESTNRDLALSLLDDRLAINFYQLVEYDYSLG